MTRVATSWLMPNSRIISGITPEGAEDENVELSTSRPPSAVRYHFLRLDQFWNSRPRIRRGKGQVVGCMHDERH